MVFGIFIKQEHEQKVSKEAFQALLEFDITTQKNKKIFANILGNIKGI